MDERSAIHKRHPFIEKMQLVFYNLFGYYVFPKKRDTGAPMPYMPSRIDERLQTVWSSNLIGYTLHRGI